MGMGEKAVKGWGLPMHGKNTSPKGKARQGSKIEGKVPKE